MVETIPLITLLVFAAFCCLFSIRFPCLLLYGRVEVMDDQLLIIKFSTVFLQMISKRKSSNKNCEVAYCRNTVWKTVKKRTAFISATVTILQNSCFWRYKIIVSLTSVRWYDKKLNMSKEVTDRSSYCEKFVRSS